MNDPTKLIESAVKLVEETLKFFLPPDSPNTSNNDNEPSDS